jgi:predicted flap endonuclease-1-like 5' DNA nuclease
MEEILTVLLGAGAIVLSPLLVPGLRPVAKSAIKGGLAVAAASKGIAEATKGAAAATGEKLQDVVTKASVEPAAVTKPAAAEASQAGETAAPPDSGEAGTPVGASAGVAATVAPLVQGLQPMVQSVVRGGQALADAAAGVVAEASKQWNDLLADARAEREASMVEAASSEAPGAESTEAQTTSSETPIASTPPIEVTPVASPETVPAVVVDTTAGPDDLRLIKGIGPKTANLLEESGVTTFKQLAAMDVWELRDILAKGGPRFRSIDPTPWPEEARRMLQARGSQTK